MVSMISFDNVSQKNNDESIALEGVSFDIAPNEFVSVVGPSGSGKTTLIKLILAEEKPTAGTVYLRDADIHSLSGEELNQLRRKIGVVFQDFRLLPNRNVFENIAFSMEAAGREEGG